jgi:hypothetical protein
MIVCSRQCGERHAALVADDEAGSFSDRTDPRERHRRACRDGGDAPAAARRVKQSS